jgi:acyl-CoA thioesterase-1
MKKIIEGFVVLLLALSLCSAAEAEPLVRIAVYGDSLTSGYKLQSEEAFPARLERKLKETGFTDIEVLNMSTAGETTTGGLEHVNGLLVKRPDIVILELGTNDAQSGINVNLIYKNLYRIVATLTANHIYVIVMGAKAPANLGAAYEAQLESAFGQFAKMENVQLYPYALEGIIGRPELNLADGIHPSASGVETMVSGIYPQIDSIVRWKFDVLRYQQQNQAPQVEIPISPPTN